MKDPLPATNSKFRQGSKSVGSIAVNNSNRATTSQAQALQRLKETKQARVNISGNKVSDAEPMPTRKVVNYATLAKLESQLQLESTRPDL